MVKVVRTWTNYAHQVPITVGTTGYKFYTEISLTMPERNPGDVIMVTANTEVSNPWTFNCQLGSYIGYGLPNSENVEPILLSPPACTNVNQQRHHETVRLNEVIEDSLLTRKKVPLTLPEGWFLTLILEAATTDPTAVGKSLIHELGYGELVAVIFPATAG